MIKTGKEFAKACEKVVELPTLYVLGAFGWPMNSANKNRAINAYGFNRNSARMEKINAATPRTFGFDCICFIKSVLWGFDGAVNQNYGGAEYGSNSVPDINADAMIKLCKDVSADFSNICIGEYLWTEGHCGVYVGNGLAVECTYRWKDGVQYTAVHNIGTKSGYNGRKWEKHGKLPWLSYDAVIQQSNKNYALTVPVASKGCSGELVEAIQMLLIGRGYSCGSYGVDGEFGGQTEKAVKAYQNDCNLPANGVVDVKTLSCLLGVDAA